MSAVFTLADLDAWPRDGTSLAVLGHPIKHSISPVMHNAALAEMARHDPRFATWRYHRFDVPPEDLPSALRQLHTAGFTGLNLTVPHKVIAFGEIAEIDPRAAPIGAVNTLRRTKTGWVGFNTDGHGLATAIHEDFHRDLGGSHIILLGAGGAARGAGVECLQRSCASLWIANRTRENRDRLLTDLRPLAAKIPLQGFDPLSPPSDLPAAAIVINATSAGLRDTDTPPIDLATIVRDMRPTGVYDMIYNPPETRLLAQARSLGLPSANGLSMLIHQGAKALEIWSGTQVPIAAMRQAAHAALTR